MEFLWAPFLKEQGSLLLLLDRVYLYQVYQMQHILGKFIWSKIVMQIVPGAEFESQHYELTY